MTSSLLLRFLFGIPGIWRWSPYSLFLWFPPMSLCFPCIFHSFLTIGSERPRSASLRSPPRGGWNLKAVLLFKFDWQVSFQQFSIELGIDFGTLGHWFSSIWGGLGPRFWGLETMFNTILLFYSFFPPLGIDFPRFWGPFGAPFSIKNRTLFHLIFNTHFNIVFFIDLGWFGGRFWTNCSIIFSSFSRNAKTLKIDDSTRKMLDFSRSGKSNFDDFAIFFRYHFLYHFFHRFFIDF